MACVCVCGGLTNLVIVTNLLKEVSFTPFHLLSPARPPAPCLGALLINASVVLVAITVFVG